VYDNNIINQLFNFIGDNQQTSMFNQVSYDNYSKHKTKLDNLIKYMYNNEWSIDVKTYDDEHS
jgi:hypothetical protein